MSKELPPIPVTVLTGFLGSGKTTLLNWILTGQHGQRIAVIENEFGEIGIDHELVINADEEIFEMNNGCICCTVRGDLIRILGNLVKRRDRFDRIIVETTGMADPGPVAQTFLVDEDLRRQFTLDGVVTLVDARHAALHLDDSEECRQQIAFGDVILINKTDLAPATAVDALEARLRGINVLARIIRTERAEVPLRDVLQIGGFDLDQALAHRPTFLDTEYPFEWGGIYPLQGDEHLVLEQGPDEAMKIALVPVAAATTEALAEAAEKAVRLYSHRMEAGAPVVHLEDLGQIRDLPLAMHGSTRSLLEPGEPGLYALFTEHLPSEFMARVERAGGECLTAHPEQGYNAAHSHDDTIGSVAIRVQGAVDQAMFNEWITDLLGTYGKDIFRSKGILNYPDEARRYVFQGVHMLVEGGFERHWPAGARENQLVFIGRRLDRELLENGFKGCLI